MGEDRPVRAARGEHLAAPRRRLAVLLVGLGVADCGAVLAGEPATAGSTWAEVRFPASVQPEDDGNLIVEGALEQRVEVLRFDRSTSLGAFLKIDYTLDSARFDFNHKFRTGAGIRLDHALADNAVVGVGVKLEDDYRYRTDRHLRGGMVFVDWYASWALGGPGTGAGFGPLGYPGHTWGGLRYPGSQDPSESDDLIVEGAVEQGIDWVRLGEHAVFDTFGSLDYIWDTEGFDYNNEIEFSVGARLKFSGERARVQIGASYARAYRWETGRSRSGPLVFLGWSTSW